MLVEKSQPFGDLTSMLGLTLAIALDFTLARGRALGITLATMHQVVQEECYKKQTYFNSADVEKEVYAFFSAKQILIDPGLEAKTPIILCL